MRSLTYLLSVMLTLQRRQRELFILFPWHDDSESSSPGTARGRGFNFTFTCKPIKQSVFNSMT